MSNSVPATNMAILANGAELTRLTVASMMSNDNVRAFFAAPAARETVYQLFAMAVHAKLDPAIRSLPTGQFKATVMQGAHQSGSVRPNVTA